MLVVSNTSPLSNLAIIDHLDLLREQFGELILPGAVRTELERHPNPAARRRLESGFEQNWLRVKLLTSPIPEDVEMVLHRGEAEALALGLELKANLVLLDEADARIKAKQLGLAHTGVLGVLRKARESGCIPSLRKEIGRLRVEARFFVHPALENDLLMSAGET